MRARSFLSYKYAQLLTLLGNNNKGFFIQYPHAQLVLQYAQSMPPYREVKHCFEKEIENVINTINSFGKYLQEFRYAISDGAIPWEEAGMFPKLDTISAYCIIREAKPQQIIEIGSGSSSFVLAKSLADNGSGELTCIDPQPRRSIEHINARIVPRALEYCDIDKIDSFAPGDVLFIDSSHIMLQGTDVDLEFNRMFPRLPPGAIVHIHDIFLPDGYPDHWRRRYYSEQSALIGWILSGYFKIIYPSFYAARRLEVELKKRLGDLFPQEPLRNAGSMWLLRT